MKIKDYFAKNIKMLRLKRGMKQAEISAQLAFTQAAWSEYELGTSKPRFNDLLRITDYFDITLSELVEMDLSKYDLNEIFELRKIVKKYDLKYDNRYDLNSENPDKSKVEIAKGSHTNNAIEDQLSRMERELKELRKKLGQ